MVLFETRRLTIRNFRAEDAADLFDYLHCPSARCFASLAVADLPAAERAACKRGQGDDYLAIVLKANGKVIGDVFAVPEQVEEDEHPSQRDTYGVGWNLNPAFGKQGYAFEAAQALFRHLFTAEDARRLYAYVEEGNAPSEALCQRLSMREEGLFREFVSFGNDQRGRPIYENTKQFALLRHEWLMAAGA